MLIFKMPFCGLKPNVSDSTVPISYYPCTIGFTIGLLHVLLSLAGIYLNGIVLKNYFVRKDIQAKVANLMLAHQATVDLYNCCVFMLPWGIAKVILNCKVSVIHIRKGSSLYFFMLIWWLFVISLSFWSSVLSFFTIAIERWLAVCRPLWHKSRVTVGKMKCTVVFVWLYSLVISAVHMYNIDMFQKTTKVTAIIALCINMASSGLYVVTYLKARASVRGTNVNRPKQNETKRGRLITAKKEKKLTIIFAVMYLIFELPFLLFSIHITFFWIPNPSEYNELPFVLLLLASVLNPVFTLLLRKDFHSKCLHSAHRNM